MLIICWTTQTVKLDILEQNSLAIRVRRRVGVIERYRFKYQSHGIVIKSIAAFLSLSYAQIFLVHIRNGIFFL